MVQFPTLNVCSGQSDGLTVSRPLPVRQRTFSASVDMSQKRQTRKSAASLDHLIGTGEKVVRNGQSQRLGRAFIQNQFKSASLNDG